MGCFCSKEDNSLRILMIGLDGAGKTTSLYQLKLGKVTETVPTVGFNVETVTRKGVEMIVWDVAGQNKSRALWRHYYEGTDGIVFIVDAADQQRIPEAKDELEKLLQEDDLKNAVLLVFSNKQDLPNAVKGTDLIELLNVSGCGRPFHVEDTIAKTGEGLEAGLDWIINAIKEKNKNKKKT